MPTIPGTLHMFAAFDWGDEIHLERALQLIPPASFHELLRRRRTPSSFHFQPPPLYLNLGTLPLTLPEVGGVPAAAGLMAFDFGAVSLSLRVALDLTPEAWTRLAGALADPAPLLERARAILRPIFD